MSENDYYFRLNGSDTRRDIWKWYTDSLRALAQSRYGEELAEQFDVPETKEAEITFREALEKIPDPDIRFEVDQAVGRIAYAYQTLGFCAGHYSHEQFTVLRADY